MKKLLLIIIKLVLFFGLWVMLVSLPFALLENVEELLSGFNGALLRLWYETEPLLVTALLTLIFMCIVDRRKNLIPLFPLHGWLRKLGGGLAWGAVWVLPLFAYLWLTHALTTGAANTAALHSCWIFIIALLLNTAMQELVMRGYPFALLLREYGPVTAVIVSSLVFLAIHGGAFEDGIFAIGNIFTCGVFLALLFYYTRNLLVPIMAHFIWNLFFGLGLGVISLPQDYPVLWPATLTGNLGTAGLEGAACVLVVNVLLCIAVFLAFRRSPLR